MNNIRLTSTLLLCVLPNLLILITTGCRNSAAGSEEVVMAVEEITTPDTVRLIFAGDVMGHMPQARAARHDGGDSIYNFRPAFQYIREYIASADMAFANLEVTFGGAPYSGYPMFSCPHELAADLKETGFGFLFTANNHAADTGKKGLEATLDHIKEAGFRHTGTFRDSLERIHTYPHLLEINNITIALLNYTYDTNGMPVYPPNIVNVIDTAVIAEDLAKAKFAGPDFIITSMHWGYEYHNNESAVQRRQAQFLANHGTDLVIGGHPHVVQPFKYVYKTDATTDSIPVIYPLGNFISNQRDRYRNGGIAFEVWLEKKDDETRIIHMAYEPMWVNCFREEGKMYYRMIPVNDFLHNAEKYNLTDSQKKEMMTFYEDTQKLLPNLPYSGFYETAPTPSPLKGSGRSGNGV